MHDPASIVDIYLSEAEVQAEQKKFTRAEELFIEAGNPSLALEMYKKESMHEAALRIANLYLPHLSKEIEFSRLSSEAARGTGGSKSDYIARGRFFEREQQYDQAIEAYLKPRADDTLIKASDLEDIWGQAVRVAKAHCRSQYVSVNRDVVTKLCNIKRHGPAAELLVEAGDIHSAVEVAISGQCWEKAKEIANYEHEAGLIERVENAMQEFMISEDDAENLISFGHTKAAMDILAKKSDWDSLWETAAKHNVSLEVLVEYTAIRGYQLIQEENFDEVVAVFSEHGAPDFNSHLPLYQDLVCGILGRDKQQEINNNNAQLIHALKKCLLKTLMTYRQNNSNTTATAEFANMLMAVHYSDMICICQDENLKGLATKCSITLLRYLGKTIPADKAFYIAGQMCREQGHTNLAFLLLNRYVDLIEVRTENYEACLNLATLMFFCFLLPLSLLQAIDDGDLSNIDSTDFSEASSVPSETELPARHFICDENDRENVRDWILTMCMESGIEKKLPRAEEVEGTVYAALYESNLPSCIITGFPIHSEDMMKTDNYKANRKDWNELVSKTRKCPWTGKEANPTW